MMPQWKHNLQREFRHMKTRRAIHMECRIRDEHTNLGNLTQRMFLKIREGLEHGLGSCVNRTKRDSHTGNKILF